MLQSDDQHTLVTLNGFNIDLVSMRDEDKFAGDSMHADKGRGMYMCINVDDVDSKHKELSESGFKPYTVPQDWPWGNREFILKDPDGYKICFWQTIGK